MCDCEESFGWTQSHSSCWADTIFMTLLIPSLSRFYFLKLLKKLHLHINDFYPCKQEITNCEKEYLIRKIWGREYGINTPSVTSMRFKEILLLINKNNVMIPDHQLYNFKPKGNMFCVFSDTKDYAFDKLADFVLVSLILSGYEHVVCVIRCDNNKWYYFDNERAKRNKKLLLTKFKCKNNVFSFDVEALKYYYFYVKKIES